MSFTGIEVVLLSPVLLMATRGKNIGILTNDKMISCSDEDVAAELESVTTVVLNNLARDGIVGSSISVTPNVSEERDARRHLMDLPLFDRAWFKRMMASLAFCALCSDSIPGDRQLGVTRKLKTDHHRRAEETAGCGSHLATPRATSFAFDTPAFVDKVALLISAPLTLTTVKGRLAMITLPAGETDLWIADIIAIDSISTSSGKTANSTQYKPGHYPAAKAEIGARIMAIE